MKGRELNLADPTLIAALSKVLNQSEVELIQRSKKEGDLALAVKHYFQPREELKEDLSINELIDFLQSMVTVNGKGSQERKEMILMEIFQRLKQSNELFFLIRFFK